MVKAARIVYFDTTKGLLMLLLVWGHMIIFAKTLGITTDDFRPVIQNSVPFYRAFFMQTFFFITGFCTSWNIHFKTFWVKNLKTIVFPAFAFMPFAYMTKWVQNGCAGWSDFVGIINSYVVNGIHWFLAALFISKLLYWVLIKVTKNGIVEWLMVAGLFILGLVFRESTLLPNNWSYQHALLMLPFLALGKWVNIWNMEGFQIFKYRVEMGEILKTRCLTVVSVVYFLLIALWQVLGLKLGFPAVDAFIDVHYITVPFHLAFAVGGTAFILIIAQALQKVGWVNLMGRQSLFVYLIHAFVVMALMKFCIMFFMPSDFSSGALFYILIYTCSIFLILLGCYFWEHKYLSWMLGKF